MPQASVLAVRQTEADGPSIIFSNRIRSDAYEFVYQEVAHVTQAMSKSQVARILSEYTPDELAAAKAGLERAGILGG